MTREELQRLTIADLLNSEAYRKRMSQMLDAAWRVEQKRRKEDVNSGRSFIRRLHEHGIENGDQFADVFIAILNKECRLSAFLRREIVEVGSSIARVILGEWQERVARDEGRHKVMKLCIWLLVALICVYMAKWWIINRYGK